MKLTNLFEQKAKTIKDLAVNNGDFSAKELTSLEGALDEYAVFDCSINALTSLEHGPKEVGQFNCSHNEHLTSLKHSPTKVLKSKFHTPNYNCANTAITTLQGAPEQVDGFFSCAHCHQLTSLEGAPKIIGTDFYCHNKLLTSLKGIHHHLNKVNVVIINQKLESHVLGLMKLKGLVTVDFVKNPEVAKIINEHLQGNVNGCNLEACQDALEEAGFEEFAQL